MIPRSRKENSWEPDASQPANVDGHWGPFRMAATGKVLRHTHIPGYLVDLLEENKEEWRTSIRGMYCCNCNTAFLFVDVFKPVPGPFMAYTFETYSYQADK